MKDIIRTERLELPLLTRADLAVLAAGAPGPDFAAAVSQAWLDEIRWLAGMRLKQVTEHPDHAPWLLRAIVLASGRADGLAADERPAMGHINFHGPADEHGVPEVGYSLLPEFRGRGYAIEAVRGLFEWARAEHGVTRFRASVAPDNARSQNLIRKLGMVRVGEQWDEEDGLEWVFETR